MAKEKLDRNPNSEAVLDAELLKLIIRNSKFWFVGIFTLCITLAWVYIRYSTPVYQSSATIQLNKIDNAQQVLQMYNPINTNSGINAEVELLRSNLVFKSALTKLPLQVSYFVKGNLLDNERYTTSPFLVENFVLKDSSIIGVPIFLEVASAAEYSLEYTHKNQRYTAKSYNNKVFEGKHFVLTAQTKSSENINEIYKQDKLYFRFNHEPTMQESLKGNLEIGLLNIEAKTIRVSFKHPNPVLARDVVSAVIEAYNEFDKKKQSISTENIVSFIQKQKDSLAAQLNRSKEEIAAFRTQNNLLISEQGGMIINSRIENLNNELLKIQLEENLLKQINERLNKKKDKIDVAELLPLLIGGKSETKLYSIIMDLKSLQELREKTGLALTKENIGTQELDDRISFQINLLKDALKVSLESSTSQKNELMNQLSASEQRIFSLPEKQLEFEELQRVYLINEKYYTILLEKEAEYALSKAGIVSNTEILESAEISGAPISPNKKIIFGLTIFIAISICVALVLIRYAAHDVITSLYDVQKASATTINILGVVPTYKQSMPNSQVVIHENPKSMISESFRTIRSNLEFINNTEDAKVIAITSTISGEGKTFVALNLAGIIAFSGKRVVLLDLDMRKPKIHKGFGVDNERGMSTLLIGKDEVKNCVRKSKVKNLDFITAGPVPPNSSELIINGRFKETIKELKTIYDIIVVDNPPVGLVTDGVPVITNADFPIYVLRNNYSKKNFVQNIDRLILENKISRLSIVLNGIEKNKTGYGYGYGYGYYGGYYEEKPSTLGWLRIFKKNAD
ncbi:MAG: GumC family protein [Flavobacteriales bacterium]